MKSIGGLSKLWKHNQLCIIWSLDQRPFHELRKSCFQIFDNRAAGKRARWTLARRVRLWRSRINRTARGSEMVLAVKRDDFKPSSF
jgi:hypothetical protein